MNKYLCLFTLSLLMLVACKKEKSFEDPNATPGSGTTTPVDSLLVKTVVNYGTDSSITTYAYNAKRLVFLQSVQSNQGTRFTRSYRLNRDAQGNVLQEVEKDDSMKVQGIDSLVFNVNYNSAASRYTYKLATLTLNNFLIRDSVAYIYDASGKITKAAEYLSGNGSPYSLYTRHEYLYDAGGNVQDDKFYFSSNGSDQLLQENTYQYDANVNPLQLGQEAFLISDATYFSKHNVLKNGYVDYQDATNNDTYSFIYTYNTANKPGSSVFTNLSGGSAKVSYYYQ